MNAGTVVAIIMLAYGALMVIAFIALFKGTKWSFLDKIPVGAYLLGFVSLVAGFIVLICATSYRPYNPNAASTKYQVTCSVCGRSFDNTSSDAKSIRQNNMCNRCYTNYNEAQDLLGN